tara:strand:- start:560 stop:1054 length:495 start_codon:yes stop_codon:yes gene_type:complete
MLQRPLSLLLALVIFSSTPFHVADAKESYTKEDKNLAKLPKVRFRDWRLRKVWKVLARQYKSIYHNFAGDGYIFPNERRELMFTRRIMRRLEIIDKRSHKVKKVYRKFRRIKKRKRKANYAEIMTFLEKKKKRYETMIRRFACRHISKYKKRHRSHCPKADTSL